jgi:hypothetical protein
MRLPMRFFCFAMTLSTCTPKFGRHTARRRRKMRRQGAATPWPTHRLSFGCAPCVHLPRQPHTAPLRRLPPANCQNSADQDTCTPADRPYNMPITPHESAAIHRLPYNRLWASRGEVSAATPYGGHSPQRSSRGPGRRTHKRFVADHETFGGTRGAAARWVACARGQEVAKWDLEGLDLISRHLDPVRRVCGTGVD